MLQGAEIEGKPFPFVRVTIARQTKIISKFKVSIHGALLEKYRPHLNNKRMWIKVRSVAFEKDWKWKYLGIVPKELRCSEISLKQAGEIQASFFSYVGEAVKGHDKPLVSLTPSQTANTEAKSAV